MPNSSGGSVISSSSQIVDETILSSDIKNDEIKNEDIKSNAAIDVTKLAGVAAKGANTDITSLGGLTTPLSVPQGGTGLNAPDDHYVLVGSGNGAITPIAPDTAGKVLMSNGAAADPTFQNPPATVPTLSQYVVGALDNAIAKLWFNIHLLFILATGASTGDVTTSFEHWIRSSTDIVVETLGALISFTGTGADNIYIWPVVNWAVDFTKTNTIIFDWNAKLAENGTGDMAMGFTDTQLTLQAAYNSTTVNKVTFCQSAAGALYATISKNGAGVTNTDISAGITLTNWNNYRIELHLGTDAKFYVNGVLKATLNGAKLPNANGIQFGFGRSNTNLFKATAPSMSLQMNP